MNNRGNKQYNGDGGHQEGGNRRNMKPKGAYNDFKKDSEPKQSKNESEKV